MAYRWRWLLSLTGNLLNLWQDTRMEYGEVRIIALALIKTRLFYVVFTDLGDYRRVISLRKANAREVKRYVSQD